MNRLLCLGNLFISIFGAPWPSGGLSEWKRFQEEAKLRKKESKILASDEQGSDISQ